MKYLDASIKIKNDGRFLQATMPDGTIIPMQLTCLVKNGLSDAGIVFCEVTLQAFIPAKDFEITNVSQFEKVKKPYNEDDYEWHNEILEELKIKLKTIETKWWYKLFKKL